MGVLDDDDEDDLSFDQHRHLPSAKVNLLADAALCGEAPVAGDDAVHFVQVPIDVFHREGKLETALQGTLHEEHFKERSRLALTAIASLVLVAGRFRRGRLIWMVVVVVVMVVLMVIIILRCCHRLISDAFQLPLHLLHLHFILRHLLGQFFKLLREFRGHFDGWCYSVCVVLVWQTNGGRADGDGDDKNDRKGKGKGKSTSTSKSTSRAS